MKARMRFAQTREDLEKAFRLRYEVYVEGQGLFGDEADHENRWLTDEYDRASHVVLAEKGGELVGTGRITLGSDMTFSEAARSFYRMKDFHGVLEEEDISTVTRLVVRPEHRGDRLGFRILEKLFARVAEAGAEVILGNCELHLVNPYHRLGFRPFGDMNPHKTNGSLIPIVVVTGDLDYFRRIDSPMLQAMQRRTRPVEKLDAILNVIGARSPLVSEARLGSGPFIGEILRDLGASRCSNLLGALHTAASLVRGGHVMTYKPGDALFLKGHISKCPYVLLRGSLLEAGHAGRRTRIGEPGSVVGEQALLTGNPRSTDLVAGPEGAVVLALCARNLSSILSQHLAGFEVLQRLLGISSIEVARAA